MMRNFLIIFFIVWAVFAEAHEYTDQLKDLLGKDFQGAKIVARHNEKQIATFDLETLEVHDIGSFEERPNFEGLSRPYWSPNGRKILFAYDKKCYLVNADGSKLRRILRNQPVVYEPVWWQDPASGDLNITFMDRHTKNGTERGKYGNTIFANLRTMETRVLFDVPCDSGLSRDGTHLGESYHTAAIIDLRDEKIYFPHRGQTCNASLSPDNRYWLMFLYLPHNYFGIKTKYGEEIWKIRNPEGSEEWQGPRWSNHPDFCSAVAQYKDGYKIAVIQISTSKMVVLRKLKGDWQAPLLWFPSGVPQVGNAAPRAAQLGTVQAAEKRFEEAGKTDNAERAQAMYRQILAEFPNEPVGNKAREALDSPELKRELEAKTNLDNLWMLTDRLRAVRGGKQLFSDKAYLKRNQALLVRMVNLCAKLRKDFSGTRADSHAREIADKYALPESTDLPSGTRIELTATIEEISRVPTARQISPYREAVTYIRYKVNRIIHGEYEEERMVVVHWGMKEAKHTPAAMWAVGTRQRLVVDEFDSHPELDRITRAADADEKALVPYWALEVESE